MRKWMLILLLAALLLPSLALAEAQTLTGIVYHSDYGADYASAYPQDTAAALDRIVLVSPQEGDAYWLQLPEGQQAADYIGAGIRLTLPDLPQDTLPTTGVLYQADTAQPVGRLYYGVITTIADDYIQMENLATGEPDVPATLRLNITEETVLAHTPQKDIPFEALYDGDTLLFLHGVNG